MKLFKYGAKSNRSKDLPKRFEFKRANAFAFIAIFAAVGGARLWLSYAAANLALPGDLNHDNTVNLTDLSLLLTSYQTTNANADINNDGKVNVLDLSILLTHYGTSVAPAVTVNISASPSSITSGASSTLSWSSTNATSCSASGGWSGTKATSGSQSTGALSASATYTLTCSGASSNASNSTTVTVTASGSEVAPESVCPNQSSTTVTVAQKNTAMICLTNYGRNFNGGLVALTQNTPLMNATASKANDIITCNDFSHTACGRPFDYWLLQDGYAGRCYGENIAQGYQTVNAAYVAWMGSSGHRANILNASYRDIGVAVQGSGSQLTWVMELGGC